MRRGFVAIVLAAALGMTPAAADEAVPTQTGTTQPAAPAEQNATPADPGSARPAIPGEPSTAPGDKGPVPTAAEPWTQPDPSVVADPERIVEQSGDSGAMTVVYAVQEGDELRIETEPARSAADAAQTVADVQEQDDLVAVDVDVPRRLTALPATPPAADPARPTQWAMNTLQAETAWDTSVGSGVTVAVIDSGVSFHPDLAGTFVAGKDFVGRTDGRTDVNGHGTHVAGIIAMTANNNIGGAGLAPGVSIMPVAVADAEGTVRAADSARGIVWAVDNGANVLNMSYSGAASSVEQKAIEYAHSKGVVTVAAVGNAYLDSDGALYNPVQYPAGFPGVLGVGAVGKNLKRSTFSEVGKQVDIAAPGGTGAFDSPRGIFSTYSGDDYVSMPGTSMAAPYVSATVALAIAHSRALGLTVNFEDVVLGNTIDLGVPGRDDEFGFGLVSPVNVLAAMSALSAVGGTAPDITPSEVTTRTVRRIQVRLRTGFLRYRIPADGRFVVAWQELRANKWSDPTKFDGKRDGRTWYTVRTAGGMKIRMLAVRAGSKKSDPIWVSPTFRTRAGSVR